VKAAAEALNGIAGEFVAHFDDSIVGFNECVIEGNGGGKQ
jgi:hypothetical protein